MTPTETAKAIWDRVESKLDDRGCFNGIDDEVMDDLRIDLIKTIAEELKKQ